MNIQRKRGFTLVELLVVMAIIAILASIVVPGVIGYIKKARATRAHSEIRGMELALNKMLADASRNSLQSLFSQQYWSSDGGPWRSQFPNSSAEGFRRANEIYTSTFYALLRSGRLAVNESDPNDSSIVYGDLLDRTVIGKLGTSYMEIGFDPYGKRYNIFPGPFTATQFGRTAPAPDGVPLPIPFRTFLNAQGANRLPGTINSGGNPDTLTVTVNDPASNETRTVGYTAPADSSVYIWSNGENGVSDQAVRAPGNVSGENAYASPDEGFMGGGDDINNWDNERSWEVFYN